MLDIIPERNRETLRSQAGTEWICDVPDVGRIRCVTFRDHRGAGGIFRMIPARAISAEQLGLSKEIQGLCAEAEGLVLVTGPRSSGKSTLISAFVDLINRTRSDHVITLENQIKFVHENRGSLVSQREVRGDRNELLLVARAALRENPDVLVDRGFRIAGNRDAGARSRPVRPPRDRRAHGAHRDRCRGSHHRSDAARTPAESADAGSLRICAASSPRCCFARPAEGAWRRVKCC